MLADTLAQGHTYLADWLFLLAVIAFGLATIIAGAKLVDRTRGVLVPLGLTLVALAWLLL
jgi:hypothetical protein